jgi:hypothetical protein
VPNYEWDSEKGQWLAEVKELPVDEQGYPVILIPERFLFRRRRQAVEDFREAEFIEFLALLIDRASIGRVLTSSRLSQSAVIDISVTSSSTLYIVECKKRVPQTSSRLEEFVSQIKRYAALAAKGPYRGLEQKLVLATPGKLSAANHRYMSAHGISVWDGPWIYHQASLVGLQQEVNRFVSDFDPGEIADAITFGERLTSLPPGKASWPLYQRLCQDIFEYLFCPPLTTPIVESRNESGTNRRDFILPNYSSSGYWEFLRKEYRADYVVVDPKNYSGKIGKERVLQVANYLQRHGTGLFGIIVCRNGADRAALSTRREQWILHDKMIIILQDEDILQMLTSKAFENDPVELIRQKIEDFRLAI